ncbi:hypothetical protein HDU96_004530, partial [Phlyctochytrium bullatum]
RRQGPPGPPQPPQRPSSRVPTESATESTTISVSSTSVTASDITESHAATSTSSVVSSTVTPSTTEAAGANAAISPISTAASSPSSSSGPSTAIIAGAAVAALVVLAAIIAVVVYTHRRRNASSPSRKHASSSSMLPLAAPPPLPPAAPESLHPLDAKSAVPLADTQRAVDSMSRGKRPVLNKKASSLSFVKEVAAAASPDLSSGTLAPIPMDKRASSASGSRAGSEGGKKEVTILTIMPATPVPLKEWTGHEFATALSLGRGEHAPDPKSLAPKGLGLDVAKGTVPGFPAAVPSPLAKEEDVEEVTAAEVAKVVLASEGGGDGVALPGYEKVVGTLHSVVMDFVPTMEDEVALKVRDEVVL